MLFLKQGSESALRISHGTLFHSFAAGGTTFHGLGWVMKGLISIAHIRYSQAPIFNEPLYNEVLGIMNDFLQPGQNYNKMYGTEPPLKSSFSNEDREPKTQTKNIPR